MNFIPDFANIAAILFKPLLKSLLLKIGGYQKQEQHIIFARTAFKNRPHFLFCEKNFSYNNCTHFPVAYKYYCHPGFLDKKYDCNKGRTISS